MDNKDLIIWLYEQKDELDRKLHVEHAEGTYRQELWAQVNLLDKIIKKVKKGQYMERARFFLVQKPEDMKAVNEFCADLENRRRNWDYDITDYSTETQFTIMIVIAWEE